MPCTVVHPRLRGAWQLSPLGARESSHIPQWTPRLLITKTNTQQSWLPWRVQSSCLGLAPPRIPRALTELSSVRSKYSTLTFNLNIQPGPVPRADSPQGPAGKSWLLAAHSAMGIAEISEMWRAGQPHGHRCCLWPNSGGYDQLVEG